MARIRVAEEVCYSGWLWHVVAEDLTPGVVRTEAVLAVGVRVEVALVRQEGSMLVWELELVEAVAPTADRARTSNVACRSRQLVGE